MSLAVLRPMTKAEFSAFRETASAEYAREKMRGEGLTADEAREVSESSFARLLPDGLATENQFLFAILDAATRERVGSLWLAVQARGSRRAAWIYDIVVDPQYRGKGYGASALALAEQETRGRGIDRMELHVFGHNAGARRLYERVGYRAMNITMGKDLG